MTRSRVLLIFLTLGLGLGGAVGSAYYWAEDQFRAAGPLDMDKTIIFSKGMTLSGIAAELVDTGIVRHGLLFKIGTWWYGADRQLKPGEYKFQAGISPFQTMVQMREGRRVARRLTIPEGLTVSEVVKLLQATDGLTDDERAITPGEGTLLPETYFYAWGDSRASLQDRMRRAMQETLAELWEKRDPSISLRSTEETVVLASIIEKETGKPAERARIAAVFHNRLKAGMRLQSDPTIIYDLANGAGPLGRELTRADLDAPTPHNTYRIDALPPTPISNPGKASILAALHPAPTKELYFVADGNGGHRFAETYAGHMRNILLLRRLQNIRAQEKDRP